MNMVNEESFKLERLANSLGFGLYVDVKSKTYSLCEYGTNPRIYESTDLNELTVTLNSVI